MFTYQKARLEIVKRSKEEGDLPLMKEEGDLPLMK